MNTEVYFIYYNSVAYFSFWIKKQFDKTASCKVHGHGAMLSMFNIISYMNLYVATLCHGPLTVN